MINTTKHLYYELRTSEKEVNVILQKIDRYYYLSEKPKMKYGSFQKENGKIKYRKLFPSTGRLKEIQERIEAFLKRKITFPDYAYGSIRGKNNILNALKHRESSHFFCVDLKNFFPSISHHQVFSMFRENGFSPTVSHILTKLTTYRGCLQQGPPTSPAIANLVFMKTGLKLEQLSEKKGIIFTTYLDDLQFSSNENFKSLTSDILQHIKSDGFCINHKKVYYTEFCPEITGILINSKGQLTVNRILRKRATTNFGTRNYLNTINSLSGAI